MKVNLKLGEFEISLKELTGHIDKVLTYALHLNRSGNLDTLLYESVRLALENFRSDIRLDAVNKNMTPDIYEIIEKHSIKCGVTKNEPR